MLELETSAIAGLTAAEALAATAADWDTPPYRTSFHKLWTFSISTKVF